MLFTTSWDDGHPLDLRVADLLHKHGIKGTFYVPGRVAPGGCCNPDGFAIMPGPDLRRLGAEFEVGSHTLDHHSLDRLTSEEARHQIVAGKRWLEDQLGYRVAGFCYPNGHHNGAVRRLVQEAGFQYARTTEDLHDELPTDSFEMTVSLHFYPRRRADLMRGFLREERRRMSAWRWPRRTGMLVAAVGGGDLAARFRRVVDRVCERGGVFHVWGHSWEIDRFDGWELLDDLLRYAAERVPAAARVTNHDVALAGLPGSTEARPPRRWPQPAIRPVRNRVG
jgi:peptidoglycan/xylan/chitin deacetylase (PgdA/CDA1 family)